LIGGEEGDSFIDALGGPFDGAGFRLVVVVAVMVAIAVAKGDGTVVT